MKKEYIDAIRLAVENQINEFRHCADVRDAEGDEESRVFFVEESNELRRALDEFLKAQQA